MSRFSIDIKHKNFNGEMQQEDAQIIRYIKDITNSEDFHVISVKNFGEKLLKSIQKRNKIINSMRVFILSSKEA